MDETRLSSVVCDERRDSVTVQVDKKGFHPSTVCLQKVRILEQSISYPTNISVRKALQFSVYVIYFIFFLFHTSLLITFGTKHCYHCCHM